VIDCSLGIVRWLCHFSNHQPAFLLTKFLVFAFQCVADTLKRHQGSLPIIVLFLDWPKLNGDDPPPSLHEHYTRFFATKKQPLRSPKAPMIYHLDTDDAAKVSAFHSRVSFAVGRQSRWRTTTGRCAPLRRIGTFGLAVGAACAFSLGIAGQVLTFRTSCFAPPPCRMPLGQSQDIPQTDPRGMATPRFRLIRFRHVISGSLALASLNRACRNLVPTFPQRSPPSLLTTAACGGLRSAPDCRPRRTYLHLSYSYASPFGPALLVTQDPKATFF
jgi:hypothetical protein